MSIEALEARIEELERELADTTNELIELREAVEEKDDQIYYLNETINERDDEIEDLKDDAERWNDILIEFNRINNKY